VLGKQQRVPNLHETIAGAAYLHQDELHVVTASDGENMNPVPAVVYNSRHQETFKN
jgi:hypothetical protein